MTHPRLFELSVLYRLIESVRRQVCRAIIKSLFVGMTQAEVYAFGHRDSSPVPRVALSSSSTPRPAACSHARRRISGACSPIPAVKTSASRPPRLAASDPKLSTDPVDKQGDRLWRRADCRSPAESACHRWTPDTPTSLTNDRAGRSRPVRHATLLHEIEDDTRSKAPHLVPMGRPSSAVKPMVAATLRRWRIAHMLAPLPRWRPRRAPRRRLAEDLGKNAGRYTHRKGRGIRTGGHLGGDRCGSA